MDLLLFRKRLTGVVKLDGMKSGLQNVKCGAPQGSILGPKMFLLYILDFMPCADEINIFLKHESIDVVCKLI